MDNLHSQILLFPHHLASTRNFDLVLPCRLFTAAYFSIRYCSCYQTQWATSVASKCSVAKKGDYFLWGQVASGDLPLVSHLLTHAHTDNCNISIMIYMYLAAYSICMYLLVPKVEAPLKSPKKDRQNHKYMMVGIIQVKNNLIIHYCWDLIRLHKSFGGVAI